MNTLLNIIHGIPVHEPSNVLYILIASALACGLLLAENYFRYKRTKGDRIFKSFYGWEKYKTTVKK